MEPLSLFYTTTVITTVFTIILTIFPQLSQMRNLARDERTEPRHEAQRPRRPAVDRKPKSGVPKLHDIQVRINVEPEGGFSRTRAGMDRHPHAQYWTYGSGRAYE
jgi:hypothetical protein